MNVRVQTADGSPALACLKRALRDVQDVCGEFKRAFSEQVDEFREKRSA